MFRHAISLLYFCLLTLALPSQAQTEALPAPAGAPVQADAAAAPAEQILIVGQRPGPGLWKVSKGEHVLWLFGTYSPLPKKLVWRSQEVEAIIGSSQEFLQGPSGGASLGFFRTLSLLPYAVGFQKSPDGARLIDLLPADVYARWLPLRKKYLGDDEDYERYRPFILAELLFSKGLAQAGLSTGNEVSDAITAIVKRDKLKSTSSHVQIPDDDTVRMVKDFKKASIDDIACFAATLDRLESDLDAMRVRANAWAKGDLDGINKLSFADRDGACSAALRGSSLAKNQPAFGMLAQHMQEAWLASAQRALETNASTFGLLKLQQLLDPDGVMAALKAKGYTVEAPE